MKRTRVCQTALAGLTVLALSWSADAGEIGHYNGGVMNIRDYVVPDPGFYGVVYNYFYTTSQLNDAQGNKISSITINPPGGGSGVTLGLSVNVKMYALAPSIIWVTEIQSLGLKFGALIAPSFVNANLDAVLSSGLGRGGNVTNASFGAGDLSVQPIWLGKTLPHWDLAFAYSFYAPVGKFTTETVTIPKIGPVTIESADNLGYGFWTQQIQGTVAWYPMTNKTTAVVTALTWEINGKKQDFDLTPGQNLTLNWGIDQMIPLKKDMSLILDIGPAGYDTWQVTNDSGSAANNARDQVHAVGGQIGLTYVPWALSAAIHGFYEYAAQDRFQGSSFGINIGKKF